jgi:hypothetical protein
MSAPANKPVKRAARRVFETMSTASMSPNEITNSARKAATCPPGPGTVTA